MRLRLQTWLPDTHLLLSRGSQVRVLPVAPQLSVSFEKWQVRAFVPIRLSLSDPLNLRVAGRSRGNPAMDSPLRSERCVEGLCLIANSGWLIRLDEPAAVRGL